MADQRSVFQPIDPKDLEGPFQSFLQPTQQAQQAAQAGPPVMASKGTSLGYLASKFIAGASQGRIKAFEAQENSKIQRYSAFQGFVSQIYSNPNLTDEAKQSALTKLSQVMGQYGTEAAGKGGGKGGKGKGGSGQEDQKPGGIKQHVHNMARDLFTGMTGGKMPKGAPDVGSAMSELQATIFDEKGQIKPQFSVPGIVAQNQTDIQRKLNELPPGATPDEKINAVMSHLQALDRYAPKEGKQTRQDYGLFPTPPPTPGSPEYYMEQGIKNLSPPPATPAPPAQAPNSTPVVGSPPVAQPGALPSPAQQTGAPVLTSQSLASFKLAKSAIEKNITFTAPDGKRVGPVTAHQVTIPGRGVYWYTQDANGNPTPVNASDVREVGLGQQSEVKLGPVVAAPQGAKDAYGNNLKPGVAVRYGTMDDRTGYFPTVHKDLSKGNEIMGSSTPPGTTDVWGRPLNPGQLYTTYNDESGAPKTYIPKAMQTEYKAGVDDEGKPYAIPVPRYQGGGGGGGEAPSAGGATPPKNGAGASNPKQTPAQTKAEKVAGAPNPFRQSATPPATPAKADGQAKPPSVPKGAISLGSAKPKKPEEKKMSQIGGRVLSQTDNTMYMANKLKSLLESKDPKTGKALKDENTPLDKLRKSAQWMKYNAGFASASDDALAGMQAFIALEGVVGAQSYMSGRFNMKYFDVVSKHIPQNTDTPKMMYEKVNNMLTNLPMMRQHLLEVEGGKFVNGVWTPGKAEQGTPGPSGANDPEGIRHLLPGR